MELAEVVVGELKLNDIGVKGIEGVVRDHLMKIKDEKGLSPSRVSDTCAYYSRDDLRRIKDELYCSLLRRREEGSSGYSPEDFEIIRNEYLKKFSRLIDKNKEGNSPKK
jgi:hypothetical protein